VPESALAVVEGANGQSAIPPVAAEVIERIEAGQYDAETLARVISRDAALAVRVLKIVNSSFYSPTREVDTLREAIALLGGSTLRSVVVAAATKQVFAAFGDAEHLLWRHAVGAAVAAAVVARQLGGLSGDEALVGGLVHDIGKLLIRSQAPDKYRQIVSLAQSDGRGLVEAEHEVLGFDHAEVALHLLGSWRLGERLARAAGAHHDLARADAVDGARPLAALLQVADRICQLEGVGYRRPEAGLAVADCPGAEVLGLGPADVGALLAPFRESYERDQAVFG
jgi:putative nucleotidyltransferase with HDIG domain